MLQAEYRLDRNELLSHLRAWNRYLKRTVHLIACGGTAMTLLGVKASTRDVDFIVPEIREHDYLTKQLSEIGYRPTTGAGWRRDGDLFHFDLFRGNRIHTTELLHSPLTGGRHRPLYKLSRLYIGVLNDYDLITSKLMRGTQVDFDDCVVLALAHKAELDLARLEAHFHELVGFDVGEQRLRPNFDRFLERLKERG